MIGIDTNVLVRFLVDDDPDQNAAARRFMLARTADDPAFVSAIALAETVWLLHRQMKFPMHQIVDMLRSLLAADGLVIEYAEQLDRLLNGMGGPAGDLADNLVVWSGDRAGCRSTVTFDKKTARAVAGMELLT